MKRPWLIKTGGELLASDTIRKKIVDDLARLSKSHPVVLVHGGGPQIEQELKKSRIPIQFVHGRRVTSPEAMILVERVLSGQINKSVTAQLVTKGVKAVGLSCRDGGLIQAKPLPQLGRAAKPEKINVTLLQSLLQKGFVPIVSSVGSDKKGQAVNINADDAASALAVALKVQNLIFLTNSQGVFDAYKKRIPKLRPAQIHRLIQEGVIQGGMIPKVQGAMAALKKGIGEVDIANGFKGIRVDSGTRILP